jgi:uncharacterized protein YjbI with pentapeptide repeats
MHGCAGVDAEATHQELVRLPAAELGDVFRRHELFRNSRPGGRRAVLTATDMSGLDLTGWDLSHADFTSASFYGANLAGCRFDCATLFACDFRQANLENASLIRADLRGCHFAGAILIGANLFSADLREGVHVSRDRKGEFHTLKPEDHNSATAISGADFRGANLTNASLSGAIAIKTDFSDATMRGCKLIRARLQGANFSGCDLAGADFGQADTRGACFRGAVLAGASFTYTDVAGADMGDALSDAPSGRLISELGLSLEELLRRHLAFIGSSGAEGASLDLSGFDLRGNPSLAGACLTMVTARRAVFYGLDLSRAAMQAAKCEKADFRDCCLDEADLRGIDLVGAKLNNASLRNANLRSLKLGVGREIHADLSGARLRHANLAGARLSGALLAGADLSCADLTGVDLTDVVLDGTRLFSCKLTPEQLAVAKAGGAVLGR